MQDVTTPMRVAVLGLGTMGTAVAVRLLDHGHEVTGWNRSPGRASGLAEKGARMAVSLEDAVNSGDLVVTTLTADDAVRAVCLGDDGVATHLAPTALLVDMSAVHPSTSRQLAEAVGDRRFVDAPILAGPATIASGEALFVVGGHAGAVTSASRLLGALGKSVVHAGLAGSGTTVKLVFNLLFLLVFNLLFLEELAAVSEAVVLAQAAGLDTQLVSELFRTSSLVPAGLQNRLSDVIDGDHRGWFPIPLARKDIDLSIRLGREHGIELSLARAVKTLYEAAELSGTAGDDVAAVAEVFRGTTRRARGPEEI